MFGVRGGASTGRDDTVATGCSRVHGNGLRMSLDPASHRPSDPTWPGFVFVLGDLLDCVVGESLLYWLAHTTRALPCYQGGLGFEMGLFASLGQSWGLYNYFVLLIG